MSQRQRQGQHVLGVRFAQVGFGAAGREAHAAPAETVGVAGLIADIAVFAGLPIVLCRAADEQAAVVIAQRLVDIDLQAIALTARRLCSGIARLGEIAEAQVAGAGKTVGGDNEVGPRGLHQLAIAQTIALPAGRTAQLFLGVQPRGTGVGDVEGESAHRGTKRQAALDRHVLVGNDASGVAGPQVGDTPLVGALDEHRFVLQLIVAIAAGRHAVAAGAGAQQLRHRGVGHDKTTRTAIGLGDGDVQVTRITGAVQVVDDEGARRHAGFVQHRAALAYRDPCVGFCRATYGWGEATL
ncbi:hypothetical protein D3C78_662830 [compost metagenome]